MRRPYREELEELVKSYIEVARKQWIEMVRGEPMEKQTDAQGTTSQQSPTSPQQSSTPEQVVTSQPATQQPATQYSATQQANVTQGNVEQQLSGRISEAERRIAQVVHVLQQLVDDLIRVLNDLQGGTRLH